MDQNAIIALMVAGIVTPWLTEIIKVFAPGEYNGKKALTLSMIVSIIISIGTLAYQGALSWSNPTQLLMSASMVLGVSGTVYQYLKVSIQKPIKNASLKINNILK